MSDDCRAEEDTDQVLEVSGLDDAVDGDADVEAGPPRRSAGRSAGAAAARGRGARRSR